MLVEDRIMIGCPSRVLVGNPVRRNNHLRRAKMESPSLDGTSARPVEAFFVSIVMFSRMRLCIIVLGVRAGKENCRLKGRGRGVGRWRLWLRMVREGGMKIDRCGGGDLRFYMSGISMALDAW